MDMSRYPKNWKAISLRIREAAGWQCEWCGAINAEPNPRTGSNVVLTVAHLGTPYSGGQGASKANKMDVRGCNLVALCQLCHLNYDMNEHKYNRTKRRKARQLTMFEDDKNGLGEPARAMSFWQPWATGLAAGFKIWETRSRATNYRGPIVICSAKRCKREQQILGESWFWRSELEKHGLSYQDLHFGFAIGIGYLVECKPAAKIPITEKDKMMGDFGAGRCGWRIGGARLLPDPVPVKGQQGWFKLPLEASRAVWRQIQ